MSFPETLEIPEPILEIARTLEKAGFEAWCVGGTLRDTLLGYPQSDYDIATAAMPEQVQALFPKTIGVGIKYGTVGVLDRQRELHEVTTFRRDVTTDGRHAVVEYGNAIKDLVRANIFPGDMLWRNFGVTRDQRVVFYDYDEIEYLTDVNFRRIPRPPNPEAELAAERFDGPGGARPHGHR